MNGQYGNASDVAASDGYAGGAEREDHPGEQHDGSGSGAEFGGRGCDRRAALVGRYFSISLQLAGSSAPAMPGRMRTPPISVPMLAAALRMRTPSPSPSSAIAVR